MPDVTSGKNRLVVFESDSWKQNPAKFMNRNEERNRRTTCLIKDSRDFDFVWSVRGSTGNVNRAGTMPD